MDRVGINSLDAFASVAGPSPWYLDPNSPICEGFHWQSAGQGPSAAGKTLLVGKLGPVAVLDFYNYVKLLHASTVLIWQQKTGSDGITSPVHFMIVDLEQLKQWDGNLDPLYQRMKVERLPIWLGGSPVTQFDLETTRVDVDLRADFPPQVCDLDELLLFCDSSGVAQADGFYTANRALVVARPQGSTYRIYPQDWFNQGGYDFGYQWATRVNRNPVTKQIQGEGIRIGTFVLDDSLRNLRPK